MAFYILFKLSFHVGSIITVFFNLFQSMYEYMYVYNVYIGASLVAQMVMHPPVMQETQVWSLGWESGEGNGYPLQCSYLENSMERGTWRVTVQGCKELVMTEATEHTHSCFIMLCQFLLYSRVSQWITHIHMSPLLWISFPFRSPQSITPVFTDEENKA